MVTGPLLVVALAVASITSAAPIFDLDEDQSDISGFLCEFFYCFLSEESEEISDPDNSGVQIHSAVIVNVYGDAGANGAKSNMTSGMSSNVLPGTGVSGNAMLGNLMPGNAVPGNAQPGNSIPINVMPGNAMPGNVVPSNAIPGNSMPSNSIPGNAMPNNAMPSNANPGM